jgi:phage tail sheath protein FI
METLHPGLFFQEVSGEKPIEGVATSTAGFIGIASKGPVNEATLITSWNEFVSIFGTFYANGYLAYAVRAFFENGGTRCYCVRVVHYNAGVKQSVASHNHLADNEASPAEVITVTAVSDGTWGDNIDVAVTNYTAPVTSTFDITVSYADSVVEKFEMVTFATIEDLINGISKYIVVEVTDDTPTSFKNQSIALTGGDNGESGMADADYVGTSDAKTGLYALDGYRVNTVAVPGITTTTVVQGIQTYVNARLDCFALIDGPTATTPSAMLTWKKTTTALTSTYLGVYYPWIYAPDPIGVGKNPKKLLPPSGYLAGVFARIDNARGVWKAPAGTEAVLYNVLSCERNINDAEQDTLNPEGINVIRQFPGVGIVSWGTRTATKTVPEYKYIPIRRLITYIENSLKENMLWTVFEPNDARLWGKIKSSIRAFLKEIWNQGGLYGETETEAFWVICDSTINTEEVIDQGRCYVDVAVAPVKPAEFIVFRLNLR